MDICKVDKICWGNTDNVWKPIIHLTFNSFDEGKNYIIKEKKENKYAYQHKYNISINIENY